MKELDKAAFMDKASELYEKLRSKLDDEKQDFYTYERKLDEFIQQFGRTILEEGLGSRPIDIRKKKSANAIWTNRNQGEAYLQ
jgi:hypothetical protein